MTGPGCLEQLAIRYAQIKRATLTTALVIIQDDSEVC